MSKELEDRFQNYARSGREEKETIKWLDLTLTYEDKLLKQIKTKLIDEGYQIRKNIIRSNYKARRIKFKIRTVKLSVP